MNTPNPKIKVPAAGRRHARYSDEFKSQVVAACGVPGASKAAIALSNGLNANMLRRWVVQSSKGSNRQLAKTTKPLLGAQSSHEFIPVKFTPAPPTQDSDIRIDIQHIRGAIQIHWPVSASSQCAQWLREVLA